MGVTFAVRGTQLNAWKSSNGAQWRSKRDSGAALPALLASAHPSVFGGSVIDILDAARTRSIIWPAWNNWSRNAAFAVLVRVVPNFTGFPPDNEAVITLSDPNNSYFGGLSIRWNSDGTLSINGKSEFGSNVIAFDTVATVAGVTGVAMDIMVSWDGVTTTSGVKVGVDGVQIEARNAAASWADYSSDRGTCPIVAVECGSGPASSLVANFRINEVVLFDNAESVTYTPRTTFWPVSALDATQSTDPGEANVRTAQSYVIAGVTKTGTLTPVTNTFTQASLIGQAPPGTSAVVLELTQGDSITLNLKALNGPAGAAVDLTGASFTTYLRATDGTLVEIANGAHAADADQVTNKGVFTCALTTAQTALLKIGSGKEIITKVTMGSTVIYFHGVKALVVLSPNPAA